MKAAFLHHLPYALTIAAVAGVLELVGRWG